MNLPAWVSCEIHIAKIDLFRYNAFVINACVFVMKQKMLVIKSKFMTSTKVNYLTIN